MPRMFQAMFLIYMKACQVQNQTIKDQINQIKKEQDENGDKIVSNMEHIYNLVNLDKEKSYKLKLIQCASNNNEYTRPKQGLVQLFYIQDIALIFKL